MEQQERDVKLFNLVTALKLGQINWFQYLEAVRSL